VTLAAAACSGDAIDDGPSQESAGPVPAATQEETDLSGVYDTAVTLAEDSCDAIDVEDHPTTLTQDGDSLTLSHAALTFEASVDDSGAFRSGSEEVTVGADTHRLTVAGAVSDGTLHALVSAEVSGSRSCRYVVAWDGPRR